MDDMGILFKMDGNCRHTSLGARRKVPMSPAPKTCALQNLEISAFIHNQTTVRSKIPMIKTAFARLWLVRKHHDLPNAIIPKVNIHYALRSFRSIFVLKISIRYFKDVRRNRIFVAQSSVMMN